MAGITLSGFNQIDFNSILEAVMLQERAPLTRLETQKKALEQQNTQLGTLASRLAALETAAENLATPDSHGVLAATSSDSSIVGVSTAGGTVPGTYDIVVTERARAQVTASATAFAATDIIATSGSLQLISASQPPVTIVVTGSMTLQQLSDAINAEADSPVAASVVQVAPGSYRLVLTGKETGAANAFTMTKTLAGGVGLTFNDPNGNGTFGEVSDVNSVDAVNATLKVNNISVTSASNTLTDVVPGATLTLNGQDPKTVHVSVTRDGAAVKNRVNAFVTAYNDLVGFVNEQRAAAIGGKPNVARDPMVQGLRSGLRDALLDEYGTGTITRLAGVGIGFDRVGKMTLNEDLFDDAVAADPTGVQQLFAGTGGGAGAFDALSSLVATYTDVDGLVKDAQARLSEQVKQMTKRIDLLDAQLLRRRNSLQQEFIAADQAMSRLTAQVGSLSQLQDQYRLF